MEESARQVLIVTGWLAFSSTLVIWAAFAIVCFIQSRPNGRPNYFAGIRFPSTMRNQQTWLAAHRVGLRHAVLSGVAVVPVTVILLFFLYSAPLVIAILEAALFAVMLGWIIFAGAAGVKAAKQEESELR
ncbi:MAG: SdpI family protein [Propionibacteriaceae bacterium]|jgi:hypothetical protein|nr:SdpI family protein [Propionibacteriaceae bacterium]